MSGLAAIARFDGGRVETRRIEAMAAAIAYRGPDGTAIAARPGMAMAHALFATSPEDRASRQPLDDAASGLLLAMDGWLANRDEVLAQLGLPAAAALSDAALALRALRRWGEDAAHRLEGEFALVMWDEKRRRALCLRDHHGLRPLYWHWSAHELVVASDIAAVLAALPAPPPLNAAGLAEIAADTIVTGHETIWCGIERVKPAHVLLADDAGPSQRRYWSLPPSNAIRYRHEGEYVEHYRAVLEQCVARAARCDTVLGCEVSGGLDSSAVLATAAALARQGRLDAPGLAGFTLTAPPGTPADEAAYARAVAARAETVLHEAPLALPPLAWFAGEAAAAFDLPPQPNAAMALNIDIAARGQGCRVMLTGLGGDQWLDGSTLGYAEALEEGDLAAFLALWRADRAAIGARRAMALALRRGPAALLPAPLRQVLRAVAGADGAPADAAARCIWLRPRWRAALARRIAAHEAALPRDYRRSYRQRKLAHPRWMLALDQLSRLRARGGVELRHPLLSRQFISFCAATPEHIRLRGGVTRWVHRRALAGLLPPEVLERRDKAEFSQTYWAHEAALLEACASAARHDPFGLFDAAGMASWLQEYAAEPIDVRDTGTIWGVYVVLLCAGLVSGRPHPQEA